MTFTPQVLTQIDNNNTIILQSASIPSFVGSPTNTTGFNTIILTVESTANSTACGIQIQFSHDNTSWTTYYTDTYFASNVFTKNYLLIKKYYRINYTSSSSSPSDNFTINSRLSTDLDSSISQNTSITVFDNNIENTMDAFGKLRVSNPTTLIDIRFPGQNTGSSNFLSNNLQICSAIGYSAGATPTGTYENSKLIINIPFTESSSKYYISQSRNYGIYQPGKSLLFMATGVFDPAGANGDINGFKTSLTNNGDTITSRIGYYDFDASTLASYIPSVRNGLFLAINYNNTGGTQTRTVSVNIKNTTTNTIAQSDWNVDKMDGTGPSGLNLDFTKTQLMLIDMEWLGVGRIRFGFYAYGRIQYCHQVTNINSLTEPYTNSINLPICYSLCGTSGGTTFTGHLTQICSTLISEGGYTPVGRPFTVSNQTTAIPITDSETPLLFLRGGSSNYYHQNIVPTAITTTSSSTNDFMLYRLRLYLSGNSPVTGGSINWNDVNSNYSVCQYATSYTGTFQFVNSLIIDQDYFYGRGTNSYQSLSNIFSTQVLQLTSNVLNVSDILVLTCYKVGSASPSNVYGVISWQEIY